jgi:hypothetical protein
VGYPSEQALLKAVDGLSLFDASSKLKGAVVFDAAAVQNSGGKRFPYKLRFKNFAVPTSFLFLPVSLPGPGSDCEFSLCEV